MNSRYFEERRAASRNVESAALLAGQSHQANLNLDSTSESQPKVQRTSSGNPPEKLTEASAIIWSRM